MSNLEDKFAQLWTTRHPNIILEREILAIPKRKFRLDFASSEALVGIEIQGQLWHKGRHNTGTGLLSSYEKHNLHILYGWSVFQLADKMITEEWIDKIANIIANKLIA
jgi:hypothetical protein